MAERGATAPQLGLLSALSAHALLYMFPNANSPGLLWSNVDPQDQVITGVFSGD